jgi:opacity protein-like surface antigen
MPRPLVTLATLALILSTKDLHAQEEAGAGDAGWLSATLGPVSLVEPQSRFQTPPPPPPVEAEDPGTRAARPLRLRRTGYYFRFSGLIVDQQEDGELSTGGSVEYDTGWGLSLAVGYRFPNMPLSLEGEYAYRRVDGDGDGFDGSSDMRLHTLAFNVLLDAPDLVGPVGVYAGIGLGVRIDEFSFSSGSGGSSTSVSGSDFYWQAKAGVNVSINERTQLFGGVVWSDAGELSDRGLTVDAEQLSVELGVRFFF